MNERLMGRFDLVRRLGRGGAGVVDLVRDVATKREYVLKRLRPDSVADPASLANEFKVLARFRHPSVVEVFELGYATDGSAWYTMPYVAGLTADAAIGAHPHWLPAVALELVQGLEAVHAAGIIHGDLKPSNVLVVPSPVTPGNPQQATSRPAAVRILDFGVAAHLQGAVGTAGFAAPEVVGGAVPSVSSDLYGLGATLYALAAGHAAFGGTAADRLRQQSTGPAWAWPLEAAGAPPRLQALLFRLMAESPSERPLNARDVRHELERIYPGARRSLAERLGTVVLAGRDRELAELEAWARAKGPAIQLVLGEPGIGRTSLFDAFAARCALAGRSVLRVDSGVVRGSEALMRHLMGRLAALATPDLPTPPELVAGAGVEEVIPAEFEEAALECIRRVANESGPLVLVIDDADQLSPEAHATLRRLALGASGSLRLLLGRPGVGAEVIEERPLRLAGELAVMRLAPFDRPAIQALIEARLAETAPDPLVSAVWSLAAGHPGLTVELLRAAAATGALIEDQHGLRTRPEGLAALSLSANLTSHRLAKLAATPAAARHVALTLAVCGGSLSGAELACLAPDAGDALEALSAAGLIRVDVSGRTSLTPPALAEGVLSGADPRDRAACHLAALHLEGLDPKSRFQHLVGANQQAEALACAETAWSERRGHAIAVPAAELADATRHTDAAKWRDRAARVEWKRGRYAAAAIHLERALAIAPADAATAERWERAASAYFRAGKLADTARAIAVGLSCDPVPATRGRLLVTDAAYRHARSEHVGAMAAADEALRLCAGSGDTEGEAHAALTAGTTALALDRLDVAEAMSDRAADCYHRCDHVLGLARSAQLRGLIRRRLGRSDEALGAYAEALQLARRSDSRLAVEETYFKLGQLHGDLGRARECRDAYRTGLRIALEDGRGASATLALLNLAQFESMSGNPREAIRLSRRAIRLTRVYRPSHEFFAWRAFAHALRGLGHLADAERRAIRALGLAMCQASREDLAWCRVEVCRVHFEQRQFAAAYAAATRGPKDDPSHWTPGNAVLELLAGRVAIRNHNQQEAGEALGRVASWLSAHPAPYVEALAAQLRAELALKHGRVTEASEHLGTALEGFAAIPAAHDRAAALLDMVQLAVGPRLDGRTPVGDWARQAATLFAELGNRRGHRQAIELEAAWLRQELERTPWDGDRGLLENVGRLLHALTNYGELTRQAMQLAVEQFNAERGVLLVEDSGSGTLEPIAQYGAEDATSEREASRFSRRLVERVVHDGTGLLVYDAPTDPDAASESAMRLSIRAMLCVPMFLHGRVVGAVYLDSRRRGVFGDADRRVLDGFAQLMAAALESSRESERLAEENLELRREVTSRVRAGLIGSSRALQRLVPAIEKAARSRSNVLLTGETGTGKDLVAKIIHQTGPRRNQPFVSVNCGALPENMLESELFGIRDRFATGVGRNEGRFQKAHRGTIFLDEVGDLPLHQQVKLLSVLTDGEVTPIGSDPIPIDVRVIAATNHHLEELVDHGKFRADLFHRLNVFRIHLPPLRERKGDIPELARHFASQFASRGGYPEPELAPDFLADLMRQDWPGNVRQLENYIERRIVNDEPEVLHADSPEPDAARPSARPRSGTPRLADALMAFERRLLIEELRRAEGVQSRAARALGLTEPTFRNRLIKHGIATRRKLRLS